MQQSKQMMSYCYYNSPIGRLILQGNKGVIEKLHFPNSAKLKKQDLEQQYDETAFALAIRQLQEYFQGTRQIFDVEIAPSGTVFQQSVWRELQKIPYGKTASYSLIAEKIGNPKGSRAVGMANNRNPIPIIIPCHRVIGKNGSLTGFGGGLDTKRFLLDLESRQQSAF